ncbi:MAG: hypothetical protein JXM79_16085 [Sedimentisphaerales bacterium]|nr:hypothetical protein [Sedimentisphaerales bacterium]
MGSFSDYWEDKILDHIFGKVNYTPPTIYVALSTSDPLDDASGLTEPTGNAYARVETSLLTGTPRRTVLWTMQMTLSFPRLLEAGEPLLTLP